MTHKKVQFKVNEASIQKAILRYCEVTGLLHWRQSLGGVIRSKNGKQFFTKNPLTGFPDIAGVCNGVPWFVELKTATGKLSPQQTYWLARLDQEGAVVGVVRSLEEFQEFIRAIKLDRAA